MFIIWWRMSFVKWHEELKKGDYKEANNETQITDISAINE